PAPGAGDVEAVAGEEELQAEPRRLEGAGQARAFSTGPTTPTMCERPGFRGYLRRFFWTTGARGDVGSIVPGSGERCSPLGLQGRPRRLPEPASRRYCPWRSARRTCWDEPARSRTGPSPRLCPSVARSF